MSPSDTSLLGMPRVLSIILIIIPHFKGDVRGNRPHPTTAFETNNHLIIIWMKPSGYPLLYCSTFFNLFVCCASLFRMTGKFFFSPLSVWFQNWFKKYTKCYFGFSLTEVKGLYKPLREKECVCVFLSNQYLS